MASTQRGPGWWMASDGKWYPPESRPVANQPSQAPPPPAPPQLPPAGGFLGVLERFTRLPEGLQKFIVGVVLLGIIALLLSMCSASRVDIGGSLEGFEVVNPATVEVAIDVRNTHSKPVTEVECTVRMGSGAYRGFEIFTFMDESRVLEPGESAGLRGNVTIKSEGAIWVRGGEVSCEAKEA